MPRPRDQRVVVRPDGAAVFVDPDPSMLPIIQALDPSFVVLQQPLPGFSTPRVVRTAASGGCIGVNELAGASDGALWSAHDAARVQRRRRESGEASWLQVKAELAQRMLSRCALCGLACGIDRTNGQTGRCGLGSAAFVYESYLHIAEEPPINPSFVVALRGCGLHCEFCQQADALLRPPKGDVALTQETWSDLNLEGARSLSFAGGNPTESLPAILKFLGAVPRNFALPIVWNCSGFDSSLALRLLDGVVDGYIPDCKYGNDECATALSGAPGYTGIVSAAMEEMCRQQVPVFVRVLVLPGHVTCCHLPSLERLAPWRDRTRLNVMSQYLPDHQVANGGGPLERCPSHEEVEAVRTRAADLGFVVGWSE